VVHDRRPGEGDARPRCKVASPFPAAVYDRAMQSGHIGRSPRARLSLGVLSSITAVVVHGAPALGVDAGTYLDYLSMKASGSVCSERMLGFAGKFEPWFTAWQQQRFVQLSRGPSALAGKQQEHGVNYQDLVARAAQALREADQPAAIKECSILLDAVRP
jgi:hypothetical protein